MLLNLLGRLPRRHEVILHGIGRWTRDKELGTVRHLERAEPNKSMVVAQAV